MEQLRRLRDRHVQLAATEVTAYLVVVAAFLVANVAAGLVRVVRGPSPADRMVAVQLFGSTGVAVLLITAEATAQPSLRIVALVFALLAVVMSVAFVKRGWVRAEGEGVDAPTAQEVR